MLRRDIAKSLIASAAGTGSVVAASVGSARTRSPSFYSQTPAENTTGVPLFNLQYPEGDIRRYGATQAAAAAGINSALKVSGAGGSAAYLPPGSWNTAGAVAAPAASSMYGAGAASKIIVASGVNGIQFTASDAGITPTSRFFRDFRIIGTLCGTTNAAHGIRVDTTVVSGVLFQNLSIENFQYGMYITGLYYATMQSCWIFNCYQGIYFDNQSVNISVIDCTVQLVGTPTITASGYSTGISVQGAPEVEGLHIQGGSIYGFDYDIKLALVFECQINAVDISYSTMCPIFFSSVLGPLVIRDCWIEMSATSGTWNSGGKGTGELTGIFVAAITPSTTAKVNISGNYVIADTALSGSTGIYLGNSNNGISVENNQILNFDVGIGGGNTLNNAGGYLVGAQIKHNTINANTSSILLNSLSSELDLGPNYVVKGALVAFNGHVPTSMVYTQPNVPMKGTATFVTSTSVPVVFTNPMPFATYRVLLGGNAAGYCWVTSKEAAGFTINCSASNSNSVDWSIAA
jgi:hypothetical protein